MVLADYNKTILDTLLNSKSEWIIIDFVNLSYRLIELSIDGEKELITEGNDRVLFPFLLDNNIKFDSSFVDYNNKRKMVFSALDQLSDFVTNRYGENIILVEALRSNCYIDENGLLSKLNCNNSDLIDYYNYFMEKTHCHNVKTTDVVIGDSLHKWGKDSYHYISEYYQYANTTIRQLISDSPDDSIITDTFYNYQNTINYIANGIYLSGNNTEKIILNKYLEGKEVDATTLAIRLSYQDVKKTWNSLANYYYQVKDYLFSAKCAYNAYKNGDYRGACILFDINEMTPDMTYSDTLQIIAKETPITSNSELVARVGRYYARDCNAMENAIKYLESAKVRGITWTRTILFDYYSKQPNYQHSPYLLDLIEPYAYSGNIDSMVRLARCYRYGLGGLSTSVDLACRWYTELWSLNHGPSMNEFFDYIIDFKDPSTTR